MNEQPTGRSLSGVLDRDDLVIDYDHRPDRHLSQFESRPCDGQGLAHEPLVPFGHLSHVRGAPASKLPRALGRTPDRLQTVPRPTRCRQPILHR